MAATALSCSTPPCFCFWSKAKRDKGEEAEEVGGDQMKNESCTGKRSERRGDSINSRPLMIRLWWSADGWRLQLTQKSKAKAQRCDKTFIFMLHYLFFHCWLFICSLLFLFFLFLICSSGFIISSTIFHTLSPVWIPKSFLLCFFPPPLFTTPAFSPFLCRFSLLFLHHFSSTSPPHQRTPRSRQ